MRILAGLLTCFIAWPAWSGRDVSLYAGQELREIKALSREDVEDLLAGRGMGYAKVAELNGYPGPLHVLELADRLGLSVEQRALTEEIYEEMTATAKLLGAELIEAEGVLEAMFGARTVDPEVLRSALERSAQIQAQLRTVHLSAHLEQVRVLSPAQVEHYAELRGYADGHPYH